MSETLDEGIGAYAEQGAAQPAPAAVILRNVTRDFDIEHGAGGSLKHKALGRSAGRREHFRALDDVSLEIPSGSTFALVGHNGSGKSTMLKLIAKIFPPTCGEIDVHGRVTALLELGAGFHPELTGRENVYLSGSISGRTRAQVDGDIEAVKDFSGLGDFFESPVKVYSSGMFVRLGFAVAVHLDPEILIVDEVVAVGDEQFQRQCFDHLRKLRRRGVTIIFVSHAIGLVEQLADRAAWLDHGVIKQVGTATEIAKSYIAAVNRAELDAQPAPVHDDASPAGEEGRLRYQGRDNAEREGRRRGTGEASVTGVEFFGADGVTPTEIVKVGEPLTVRMHFRTNIPLEDPTFGLAVHSEQGWPIAGPNTRVSQHTTGVVTGAGHIDFHMPECLLAPGALEFSAAITDHSTTHIYDGIYREFHLKVLPGDGFASTGMVVLSGDWVGPTSRS